MKIAVAGLWHLGTVTAACLASLGHEVLAFDESSEAVANLRSGGVPVKEPGLAELIAAGMAQKQLSFTDDPGDLASAEALWICYDTPVNDDDVADDEFVCARIRRLVPHLRAGGMVLISSQLPVGTTARLHAEQLGTGRHPAPVFACIPENLRLGRAIEAFKRPDRIVAGVGAGSDRGRIAPLLESITPRIEWMSVESAEMTKHALNAFLATSVAFINEIASLCEQVGADALEVERGLKSDARIGQAAYLHAGAAFAGGTLARDINFLLALSRRENLDAGLLSGVQHSNTAHRLWATRRLIEVMGSVANKRIAMLGLTYKPGTNTLRRSSALEICRWLAEQGATVQAFDPAVGALPQPFTPMVRLAESAAAALEGADAAIIATAWPEFTALSPSMVLARMKTAVVIDPGRYLQTVLGDDPRIHYLAVGKAEARISPPGQRGMTSTL